MLGKSLPLMVSNATFVICSYLVNVWLARHLGVSTFGSLGLITAFMTALNVLQTTGIPQAMAKFIAEDPKHADSVLWSGLKLQTILSVGLLLLSCVLAPLLSVLLHDASLTGYLLLIALIFPGYGAFTIFGGYYNGRRSFVRQAQVTASYAVAKLLFVVGLSVPLGLVGAIVGYVLAPGVAVAVGFRRPSRTATFPTRQLLMLSLPLVGFAGLALLQYSVDLFSVRTILHSKTSTGFYVAAQSVSVIPFLGLAALGQVLFPNVSRLLAQRDMAEAARAVRRSVRYLLALLLPSTALIAGSASGVIRLLYGTDYAGAVPVLRVLVLSYTTVTLFSLFANVLNGAGQARTAMVLAGVGLLVTLGLCIIFIPSFHLIGAASSTGVGAAVATLGAVVFARRAVPFTVSLLSVLRIAGASLVIFSLAALPAPWWSLLVAWPGLAIFYIVLLVVLGEITANERRGAVAAVRRFAGRPAAAT